MLSIQWEAEPSLVKVCWDDATNLATWQSKDELEEHWEQMPFRCENIGYLIGRDGTGALYIAARKGMINEEVAQWGLVERLPKGMITKVIFLGEGPAVDIRS